MNVLVTGGAGYIGAHCCKALASQGHHPVIFDSLITGHRQHVQWGDFFRGDINNDRELDACLSRYKIDAAMHFAAFIEVGESVANPQKYYANNVAGTLQLLQALVRNNIRHFVFSSSAAVYGNPLEVPINEQHPARPLNPYGWTKLMIEIMLGDFQSAYGLNWIALRYFNAAGADEGADIGEWHDPESHLIPRILDAALDHRQSVRVYGTDYPTPDGTCIRDYIHVNDLAGAHVRAFKHLASGGASGVYNLGQGRGYSVMEVIAKVREITGRPLVVQKVDRRPGEAAVLIASNQKALQQLGWYPRHSDLDKIIASAWKWHRTMRGAL
jgi:UDP-glucose-4-epimerase GalE